MRNNTPLAAGSEGRDRRSGEYGCVIVLTGNGLSVCRVCGRMIAKIGVLCIESKQNHKQRCFLRCRTALVFVTHLCLPA